MKTETATQLFKAMRQQGYPIEHIAESLSLHRGTVMRWEQKNKVPEQYKHDILRLLGKKADVGFLDERDKDQFYTKESVALACFNKFKKVAKDFGIDLNKYTYIEPSAGCGCFFKILPKNKIGVDIEPNIKGVLKSDYLKWKPKKGAKCVVVGNPPFGLRGNKALQFINHSFDFADMVAFILPPLFDSDGKGAPGGRVKGYKLAYTEKLPPNSFYYPDGTDVDVSTIFQVWTKVNTDKIPEEKSENLQGIYKSIFIK